MDWNAQIAKDLKALDGIVAILLSLAGLAARSAGAPLPVRWLLLWFIRRANAVATEFVSGSTGGAVFIEVSSVRVTVGQGNSPADANDLALPLSMLAGAVAVLATQLRTLAFLHRGQRSGATGFCSKVRAPTMFGMTVLPVGSDTS
jgi:mannose/fructose/N-acetylgalactosamine-specific phosphotransferase system component IIC